MEVITLNHAALHHRRRRRGKVYPILSASSVNRRSKNNMEDVPVVSMKRVQLEQQSELIEIENRRQLRYDTRLAASNHTMNERSSLMNAPSVVSPSKPRIVSRSVEDFPADVNGSSRNPSSTRRNLKTQQQKDIPHPWLHRCWTLHFVFAISVLAIGIMDNIHPVKKYLPISPSLVVDQEVPCSTAYLNVLAGSAQEADGIVCCPRRVNPSSAPHHHWIPLETDICTSKSETLPLASRLAKFPEAWLLPLFPILLRLLVWIVLSLWSYFVPAGNNVRATAAISCTLRRFCFYIVVLNFRGWILYVLFNEWEDRWAVAPSSPCWYESWFAQHSESSVCLGRPFDFSDHIVLYYAQLLPIALLETLHALFQSQPFCMISATKTERPLQKNAMLHTLRNHLIPFILIGSHVYLQFITATGAYKTSAYFHTPMEVVAGFAVSMIITVPLYLLQCNTTFSWAASARSILFG